MHLFMHDRARVSTTVRQPLLVSERHPLYLVPVQHTRDISRLKVVLLGLDTGPVGGTRPLT